LDSKLEDISVILVLCDPDDFDVCYESDAEEEDDSSDCAEEHDEEDDNDIMMKGAEVAHSG
jgi:hypothetical protein